ncbi:helix-turn-helix domain-containing protein [Saccharomonospora sp. NPDC046836]|uniref:TetR/AcrR family transcriptional regulator n=1 Tax=Saccharomonospora sp. NPDC046836 TaxID=3156921 RepID=UPI00340EAB92
MATRARPLRADAERSVRAILEAAERVLAGNPAASMEQIAEAAGVARTTIHRRFASRQALLGAMAETAVRQLGEAIEASRPEAVPPVVALHQITANVLRVKVNWAFALNQQDEPDSPTARAQEEIARRCLELLGRAQRDGMLDADADLAWVRRVYYALIGETLHGEDARTDPDVLAARIVDTLLNGSGPRLR